MVCLRKVTQGRFRWEPGSKALGASQSRSRGSRVPARRRRDSDAGPHAGTAAFWAYEPLGRKVLLLSCLHSRLSPRGLWAQAPPPSSARRADCVVSASGFTPAVAVERRGMGETGGVWAGRDAEAVAARGGGREWKAQPRPGVAASEPASGPLLPSVPSPTNKTPRNGRGVRPDVCRGVCGDACREEAERVRRLVARPKPSG